MEGRMAREDSAVNYEYSGSQRKSRVLQTYKAGKAFQAEETSLCKSKGGKKPEKVWEDQGILSSSSVSRGLATWAD